MSQVRLLVPHSFYTTGKKHAMERLCWQAEFIEVKLLVDDWYKIVTVAIPVFCCGPTPPSTALTIRMYSDFSSRSSSAVVVISPETHMVSDQKCQERKKKTTRTSTANTQKAQPPAETAHSLGRIYLSKQYYILYVFILFYLFLLKVL